jgi:sulfonate transport system permease protein
VPSREDTSLRPPARWQAVAGGAIVPLVILAGWSWLSSADLVASDRLPSPQDVVLAGVDLARRGLLFDDAAVSIQRVLLGFVLGSAAGALLGALVGRSPTAGILLSPTIRAVRSVPTMAWLPFLLLALGIGEAPKIALIAIGAAFPVFTTLVAMLQRDDPAEVRPALIPDLVHALRLALAQSWVFLVAAELIHSTAGLGVLLIDSSNAGRMDRLFVAIVLLAILGRFTDLLLAAVERRVPGHRD